MNGSQVATVASGGIQGVDKGNESCISTFREQVGQIFPQLIQAFKENVIDFRKYGNANLPPTMNNTYGCYSTSVGNPPSMPNFCRKVAAIA